MDPGLAEIVAPTLASLGTWGLRRAICDVRRTLDTNKHFFGTKKSPDRLRLRRRIECLVQEASGIYLIVGHLSSGKTATAATDMPEI